MTDYQPPKSLWDKFLWIFGGGGLTAIIVALVNISPDLIQEIRSFFNPIKPLYPESETISFFDKTPPDPEKTFEMAYGPKGHLESDGSVSMISMMRALQAEFELAPLSYGENDRRPLGTEQGIEKLKTGSIQMAPISRRLTDTEKNAEGLNEIQIAIDAIVIIVHKDNPVDSLTVGQLRKIYTCEITDWTDVGWSEESRGNVSEVGIEVVNRSIDSGTRKIFKSMVLKSNENFCDDTVNKRRDGSSFKTWGRDETTAVLRNLAKGGIYYGSLSHFSKIESIKILDIEGIPPNHIAILSYQYPLVRNLYLAAKKRTYPEVIEFIRFTLSPEGQKIVGRYHIPIYRYWDK